MNYLIALGSNRPREHLAPFDTLSYAIWLLGGNALKVMAQSRFFVTPAVPQGAGPDCLRVAVQAQSEMEPPQTQQALDRVETALNGNSGDAGPVLEIEMLACGDRVLPNLFDYRRRLQNPLALADDLVLPHPALHQCPAFLTLLLDIAPDWRHPVLHNSVREMATALPAGSFDGIALRDGETGERDVAE